MILNHGKFTINVSQMIKVMVTKPKELKYESIILNHCWVEIELILDRT
jgi:hypothetical protein